MYTNTKYEYARMYNVSVRSIEYITERRNVVFHSEFYARITYSSMEDGSSCSLRLCMETIKIQFYVSATKISVIVLNSQYITPAR